MERFEAGEDGPAEIHDQLQQVLEAAGVELTPVECGSPGVKLATGYRSRSGAALVGISGAGSSSPADEDAT